MQRLIPIQGFSVMKYFVPIIKPSHPISIVNEIISHQTDSTHNENQKEGGGDDIVSFIRALVFAPSLQLLKIS